MRNAYINYNYKKYMRKAYFLQRVYDSDGYSKAMSFACLNTVFPNVPQPLLKPSNFYSFCRPPGLYSGGFFAMLEMEYYIREVEGNESES